MTAFGCADTQVVTLKVQPKTVLSGSLSDTVCSGAPFTYLAASLVPGTTFAWTRVAASGILPLTGSGSGNVHETLTNTTLARHNTVYHYTLTANTCQYTQNVPVTVNPQAPVPSITTFGPSAVCSNTGYMNFGAATPPIDTVSYSWTATNATVWAHGSSEQYALVSFPNSGHAVVTLSAFVPGINCISKDTFAVIVSTSTAEEHAVVYLNNQFAVFPADEDTYQWGYDDVQLDSTVLSGETHQDYINPNPDADKAYWVITTKKECLQKTYYKVPTGVKNVSVQDVADIRLYPNPANEVVTIELSNIGNGSMEVEILNMIGQKVGTIRMNSNKGSFDVSSLTPGSYIVGCYRNGLRIATAKFVKD